MALLLHFPTPQDGADAYQTWLDNGNTGTFSDYLKSITGEPGVPGLSSYQLAVNAGFIGTEAQWRESQKITGPPGKSAYQSAVDNGYSGTETQWSQQMTGIKTNITSIAPAYSSTSLVSGSWVRVGSMYTVYLLINNAGSTTGGFTVNIPNVTIPRIRIPIAAPGINTFIVLENSNPAGGNELFFSGGSTAVNGQLSILFSFIL